MGQADIISEKIFIERWNDCNHVPLFSREWKLCGAMRWETSMATLRNAILVLSANPDVRRFLTGRAGLDVEHNSPDLFAEKLARLDEAVASQRGNAKKTNA